MSYQTSWVANECDYTTVTNVFISKTVLINIIYCKYPDWKGNPGSFSARLVVFYILLNQLLTVFMYRNQCFEPTFVKVKCLPFWKPLLSVCWSVTRPSSSPPPFSLSPLAACCKSYRHTNKRQIHTGQAGEHGQGSVRVAAATPADWHTRDKALSGETTAGKDLDPLINKSHTDSLFQAADRSQFVKRSSESDSVRFWKKRKNYNGQPSSDQVCLSR